MGIQCFDQMPLLFNRGGPVKGTTKGLLIPLLLKDFYSLITLSKNQDKGLLMVLRGIHLVMGNSEGMAEGQDQGETLGMSAGALLAILNLQTGMTRALTILDVGEISGAHPGIGLMVLRESWVPHQGTWK